MSFPVKRAAAWLGMTRWLADVPAGMFRLFLTLALLFTPAAGAAEPLRRHMDVVERVRELKFSAPVVQKTISREELRTYLADQFARQLPVSLKDYLRILDALELVENREGMLDSLFELYQSQVLAFYDPATDVYYSLDEPPGGLELNEVMAGAVAIHELAHALQDQSFAAGDRLLAMKGNSDAQMAYQAVLEGEALLIMTAALLEQFGQDLDTVIENDVLLASLSMMAELNPGIPAGIPPYFVESLKFPYFAGLGLVVSAYRRGGWKAVDALHRDPPVSTEQVLHPDRFLDGAAALVPSKVRPRERRALLAETMGEFGWRFLLGEEAASGWGGDCVEVKEGASDSLTVFVDTTWDTKEDARQFADAYALFLESRSQSPTIRRKGRRVSVTYSAR